MENNNCNDFELCKKLGRHLHGKEYILYTTREDYRKTIDKFASEKKQVNQQPSIITKALNFTTALANHALTGFQKCSPEETEERLNECRNCPYFNGTSCSLCGCRMNIKAEWVESDCPHPDGSKWKKAKELRLLNEEKNKQ